MGRHGAQAHLSDHRARPARNRDGQEAAHRSEPPAGGVDGQAIQQPRPAFSGSDPGRQHGSDEGRRQIRLPARLQVLYICHVVDPAGNLTSHRLAGPDHPDPGPYDRSDLQAGACAEPTAAGATPRSDSRGAEPEVGDLSGQGARDHAGGAGAGFAGYPHRGGTGIASRAISSWTRKRVSPSQSIINLDLREQTAEVLKMLAPREGEILKMRFGLEHGRAYTLEEVGLHFALTPERIRQIEADALKKLRDPSRGRHLRTFLERGPASPG